VTLHWFDDATLVRQLPPLFRGYAGYMRRAVDRRSGVVRGGSFLHRLLSRLIDGAGLRREARLGLGGLVVHVDLCDPRMFWVLGEVRGDTAEAGIIRALLRPGDIFLDVGANHGSYALLAARAVGPTGAVFAFEPQPRLADLLRRSFEANGFAHASVEQVACAIRAGTSRFFVPSSNSGAGGMYRMLSAAGRSTSFDVPTVSLDAHLADRLPAGRVVMKIDVEGAELVALRGARRLLAERRPPLILEVSPQTATAGGHRISDVVDLLVSVGYARYAEVDDFPAPRLLRDLPEAPQRNVVVLS
jgi:FkbM family methyltransferase